MSNPHRLAHQQLAQALLRLPGQLQPSRAVAQAVGDRLASLVAQAVRADNRGKLTMSGWPAKGEASARAVLLRGERAGEFGTSRLGAVMVIRDRHSAGMVRVLDRGRNMGQAGRRGVVGGLAQGPGVNQATGFTARTKSGQVRKVRAVSGRRWNGYTPAEHTWADALRAMRSAAPGLVAGEMAAEAAAKVRKVVLGG